MLIETSFKKSRGAKGGKLCSICKAGSTSVQWTRRPFAEACAVPSHRITHSKGSFLSREKKNDDHAHMPLGFHEWKLADLRLSSLPSSSSSITAAVCPITPGCQTNVFSQGKGLANSIQGQNIL